MVSNVFFLTPNLGEVIQFDEKIVQISWVHQANCSVYPGIWLTFQISGLSQRSKSWLLREKRLVFRWLTLKLPRDCHVFCCCFFSATMSSNQPVGWLCCTAGLGCQQWYMPDDPRCRRRVGFLDDWFCRHFGGEDLWGWTLKWLKMIIFGFFWWGTTI